MFNYTGEKGLQLLKMSSIDFSDLVNISCRMDIRIA